MADRHGMVTRTFKTQTYIIEALDRNGGKVTETVTALGIADMKSLREKARKSCYDKGLLFMDLHIKDQGDQLYGMAIEKFIKDAKRL